MLDFLEELGRVVIGTTEIAAANFFPADIVDRAARVTFRTKMQSANDQLFSRATVVKPFFALFAESVEFIKFHVRAVHLL